MLFLVTIYCDGAAHWSCVVDAEDRDGAIREAMTALNLGRGTFPGGRRQRFATTTTVEADPIPRNYRRLSITQLMEL